MRRLFSIAAIGAFALAGCGSTGGETPAACLEGAPTYLHALTAAPGAVRLGGETPISDCLAENQAGGDLATVGAAMLAATTKLNAEARAEPGEAANVQLGYLIGAAQRGAERTEGVHAELLRRLTAAARYSPDNRPLPKAFYRAYKSGYAAGQRNG
jgi:hypothetical protein